MEINRIISLANKLKGNYSKLNNSLEIYRSLLTNDFLMKQITEAEDLIKLTFFILTLNKGLDEKQSELLVNNLYGILVVDIGETNPIVTCHSCGGEGEVNCHECDASGYDECNHCDGTGEFDDESCDVCDGEGGVDCVYCDGVGKVPCEHCDGDGGEELLNHNMIDKYYLVSINPQLKNELIVSDIPKEISDKFHTKLISDPYTITLSIDSRESEDYFDDYRSGDIVLDRYDEEPIFSFVNSLKRGISFI